MKKKNKQKSVFRRRFALRALLLYAVVSAGLTAAVTLSVYRALCAHVRQQANDAGAAAAAQAYAAVGGALENTGSWFSMLYRTPDIKKAMLADDITADEQAALLRLFTGMLPESACVDSVYLFNRRADAVFSSAGIAATFGSFYDRQAAALLTKGNNGKFIARQAQYSLFGRQYIRRFLSGVYTAAGSADADGGVIVNIDAEKLMQRLRLSELQANYLYITAPNGEILAHTDSALTGLSVSGEMMAALNNSAADSVQLTAQNGGEACLVNAVRFPKLNMWFISAVPVSRLAPNAAAPCLFTAGAAAGAFALAYVLAQITARRCRKKQQQVADAQPCLRAEEFCEENLPYNKSLAAMRELRKQAAALPQVRESAAVAQWLTGRLQGAAPQREFGLDGNSVLRCIAAVLPCGADLWQRCAAADALKQTVAQRYRVWVTADMPEGAAAVLACRAQDDDAWLAQALCNARDALQREMQLTAAVYVSRWVSCADALPSAYQSALRGAPWQRAPHTEPVQMVNSETPYAEKGSPHTAAENSEKAAPPTEGSAVFTDKKGGDFFEANASTGAENAEPFCAETRTAPVENSAPSQSRKEMCAEPPAAESTEPPADGNAEPFSIESTAPSAVENAEPFCAEKRAAPAAKSATRKSASHSKKARMAQQGKDYMQAHYSEKLLSVEAVARALQVSAGHFRTGFKAATGESPAEYLTRLRLDKAKLLLRTTAKSGREVAEAVGYECRYFYSLFKARNGVTVTEYRERTQTEERHEEA